MPGSALRGLVVAMFGLGLAAFGAPADRHFAGTFQGENLSVEIAPAGPGYAGTIHLGRQQFPFKAREQDGALHGTFTSNSGAFDFTATIQGQTLTLVTGGKSYAMRRLVTNPLARPGAANPPGAGAAEPEHGGQPLAGYTVALATESGKTLTASKPNATTVRAALESTFPDLARYFDGRPAIQGAFEDARDHRTGGASFTAKLHGQPVKGFVSTTVGDKGASVAVAYCRADAPMADWLKLMSAAGSSGSGADVKLTEYRFPDGTGSIGLADGWKTNAQTCVKGIPIQGPADQEVLIGLSLSVVTPDAWIVQNQRQMEANARQMGLPPPAPLQLLVAPFTGPAEALKNLTPQISRASQRAGGPAVRLDKIVDQQKVTPISPNANAALLTYDVTRVTRGTAKPFRAVAQIETIPVGPGTWMLYAIEGDAPRETFDRDLPVMLAMVKSLKTNDAAIAERTRQEIDAQNRNFAALQQAHREQVEAFDRYNEAWRRRENIQDRSFADFDEVIRGYRTVEDTRTGEHASVDLGNVRDIVERLNERDPGRYKEIPLRDEMYPKLPEPRN